jgi:hypothetical protein
VVLLVLVFGLFALGLRAGLDEADARTAAFVSLMLGNLGLALANVSGGSARLLDPRRRLYWYIFLVAIVVLAACLLLPPLPHILRLTLPGAGLLLLAVALAVCAALAARLAWRVVPPEHSVFRSRRLRPKP